MSTYCEPCKKFFNSRYNLKRHEKTKHNVINTIETEHPIVVTDDEVEDPFPSQRDKSEGNTGSENDEESIESAQGDASETDESSSGEESGSEDGDTPKFTNDDNIVAEFILELIDRYNAEYKDVLDFFYKLCMFFRALKRSNVFKAVEKAKENLKEEQYLMSNKEAYAQAIHERKFYLMSLFNSCNLETTDQT